ncbi:MAG: transketolase [Microgenomates group bacterium]
MKKTYSISELVENAALMRGYCLTGIHLAGSGHPGGSLSIMDITAALYLRILNHDPKNPDWEDRDRVIFSAGHKAPALYVGLAQSGYFPIEDMALLRKFGSPLQGHPHWLKLKGVEVSTGSLGQGLSLGVGIALAARLDKKNHYTYVISGDGEWDEGQMWEAVLQGSHHKLDHLVVVVDRNQLQIDGCTEEVLALTSFNAKLSAFGWHVIEIDGHDMKAIVEAFEAGKKIKGQPVAIVANTVKGKGVSFMEGKASWHGKAPKKEELLLALKELGVDTKINVDGMTKKAIDYQKKIDKKIQRTTPKFKRDYHWNALETMKVVMEPTRSGFGNALAKHGKDERVVVLGSDITESVKTNMFYKDYPERKNRFLSMGITEQSTTSVAAGLARENKLPIMSTYGVFISQRNADQMRTTVCYGELNVLFAGAHGGISVGPDGATHQSLEEFSVVGILPNMKLVVPADSNETEKATTHLLFKDKKPKYIRFAREATPVITTKQTPFILGKANVYRFRKEKSEFINAFDVTVSTKYKNEKEDLTIISCGPEFAEALKAAWILKTEYKIETRVINMHTIKPLDKEAIIKAALETKAILTVEEHQKGGLGNLVAAAVMEANIKKTPVFSMIGINDRFGDTGQPWELIYYFGLSGEHVAKHALTLLKK